MLMLHSNVELGTRDVYRLTEIRYSASRYHMSTYCMLLASTAPADHKLALEQGKQSQ